MLSGRRSLRPGKVRFADDCPASKIILFVAFNSVERELGSWRWRWEMGMGEWVGAGGTVALWVNAVYTQIVVCGSIDCLYDNHTSPDL